MTDDPAWFEDEFEQRPRRRLVVAGAAVAVAWAVVAAMVLLIGDDGSRPVGTETADDETVASTPGVPDEGPGSSTETTGSGADEVGGLVGEARSEAEHGSAQGEEDRDDLPSPGATTVSRDQAEAVTVAVTRAWLSDGGPDLQVPGVEVDRRAYLEHVTVEGFDLSGPELAVARVQLVLLVRDGDHYTEAIVRRAAVPLLLSDAAAPAGQPWFVPGAPELISAAPASTPVEDPEVASSVEETLIGAGYLDPEVGPIGTTRDGSLVAQVTARTPEGEPVDGPVWLAPTAGGLVLLGAGA